MFLANFLAWGVVLGFCGLILFLVVRAVLMFVVFGFEFLGVYGFRVWCF